MRLVCQCWVEVEDGVHLDDLPDYLQEAVTLEIDTETYGSQGVESIEIDWTSQERMNLFS